MSHEVLEAINNRQYLDKIVSRKTKCESHDARCIRLFIHQMYSQFSNAITYETVSYFEITTVISSFTFIETKFLNHYLQNLDNEI